MSFAVQSLEINPIDIVLDALQYSREAAIFYLVPNDGNVGDFQRAYELGLFEGHPRLKEGLQGIVIVLSCVPMLIRAMQAWRMEHPNQLMILRIYTVAPTSFLQPAEKLILPLAMGPMAVIGRGRPSGGQNSDAMLATLHVDCTFNGVPFSKHMENPQNGFFVAGVGFSYTNSELVWQVTAGGVLAFTVAAICGPLLAGVAGIGLAVGAIYIPAGTTLKYLVGAAAARIGAFIAAAWTSRPHPIEAFRVFSQLPFRRIMARDIYGTYLPSRQIQIVEIDEGDVGDQEEASSLPSYRTAIRPTAISVSPECHPHEHLEDDGEVVRDATLAGPSSGGCNKHFSDTKNVTDDGVNDTFKSPPPDDNARAFYLPPLSKDPMSNGCKPAKGKVSGFFKGLAKGKNKATSAQMIIE